MRKKIVLMVPIIIAVVLGLYIFNSYALPDPNVNGIVSFYSPGPGPADEPAVFAVDGEQIYIGGDMSRSIAESFDTNIQTGDAIEAYVVEDENGRMTIVDCDKCYVRKR